MAGRKSTKKDENATVVEESATVVSSEKKVKNTKNVKPLSDTDEIEIVSLIPNVSYLDKDTNDYYEWVEVGHIELMTFATVKRMWRNNKPYFRDMMLKPNDKRVIKQFNLEKTFDKYLLLMDGSNYTKDNIDEICKTISSGSNGFKYVICNKIKDLIINGEISNISIVKKLEKIFDVDFTDFIE